jgi:TatD DNase family protein
LFKLNMRVDTHCHIDLFDDPIATARTYESAQTECVMVTMLPNHYQAALPHLEPFRTVRPALGMHPLRASEGKKEISMFINLVYSTEYIGEIGLDFSSEGRRTQKLQSDILRRILPVIGNGKFVTVHSRNAHDEVSSILDEYNFAPVCFHYFIGGPHAAEKLAAKGHYFSINHRMLLNKHRSTIDAVPRDRILIESDGPFLTEHPLLMIDRIYNELSKIWHTDKFETEDILALNFSKCRTIVSKQS